MLISFLSGLWNRHTLQARRSRHRWVEPPGPAGYVATTVEALEDRTLLSATVISIGDTGDFVDDPSDPTSLREAIIHANTNAGDFEIQLAAGVYYLTLPGVGETEAATGDLDILDNGSVTIVGAGQGETVIHAGGNPDEGIDALGDGVFQVHAGAELSLEGLTITGGTASGQAETGNWEDNDDGGISNDGGSLWLTDVLVAGNEASHFGSRIYNIGSGSTVTLTGSTIVGNQANNHGGGIVNVSFGVVRDFLEVIQGMPQ